MDKEKKIRKNEKDKIIKRIKGMEIDGRTVGSDWQKRFYNDIFEHAKKVIIEKLEEDKE